MNTVQCPVCTLYLREGITLKEHLDTHPKDKVIEALVSSSEQKAATVVNQANFQNSFIQSPFQINNHVANPMQFSIIQPNPEQIQTAQSLFVPNIISNRRYIVSQPGTIIKVPQRNQEKVFTALSSPFCNQIIGTPNYGSPQIQIPARAPHPHILSSNTQNINTQGGPAIIYSQIPAPVQSVPNVQQTGHFQGVQNYQPQAPVVVPHSSSMSTPISSNAPFCNSSLQQYSNTITPVQSAKTPTPDISLKDTPIFQDVSNNQEYCNASTQVSTVSLSSISNNISLIDDAQYEKKLYEELKDSHEDNDQYEYFDSSNGVYELEAHYNSSNDETISEMKEEPEYMEDDKSNIELSTEDDTNVAEDEQNKENEYESSERNEHSYSTSEYNELESVMVNADDMVISDCNVDRIEEIGYDEDSITDIHEDSLNDINEESLNDIHEDVGDREDELFESLIDIDENDITSESVDYREQEKEIDLSKSSICKINMYSNGNKSNVSISPATHNIHKEICELPSRVDTNFKPKMLNKSVVIEPVEMHQTKEVLNKNKVSITCVSYSNQKNVIEPIELNQTKEEVPNKNKVSITYVSNGHQKDMIEPVEIHQTKEEVPNKNNVSITYVNYSNQKNKIEPVKVHQTKEEVPNKNKVSITYVSNSSQKDSETAKKIDLETKRKIVQEKMVTVAKVEEPQEKKQKLENIEFNTEVVSVRHGLWAVPIMGNASYKIEEVMYSLKAFGNTTLGVHKLDIHNIKTEKSEEDVRKSEIKVLPTISNFSYTKGMPSTSSTPDVTVHLLSRIKTEPDISNKAIMVNKVPKVEDTVRISSSILPSYNGGQKGNLKKTVKVLQIKNAKKRDNVEEPSVDSPCSSKQLPQSQNSVIQHPVKTEPPSYDTKHGILPCQSGSSNPVKIGQCTSHFLGLDLPSVSNLSHVEAPSVHITPSKYLPSNLPSPRLQSPSLQDYTDLVVNTKLDRLTNLHHTEYDSVDTPHWLLRGINILPQVIEDDRISCASPKTLLNLDHQTSFQTFEPDDSGSTSINMQTDEMMPPRGELSGQESLESSVWGYQEDNGASQYRQWEEMEQEVDNVSNSNTFKTKIEKAEPIELLTDKIKLEEPISILPIPSNSNLNIVTKKKHACIYCNKTFTGWKLRKYHMKTEHPEFFNEPETGKLLTKVQTSTSTVVSEPSTSFVSQATCPLKFETSNSFSTQLEEFLPPSSGLKTKQRQCVNCSEVFDKLKPYQDHIRNVHPLVCPLCNKTFLAKSNLTLHMRTHLKIKPYKCDVCEKSFVTAQKLSDHKNTHTGNAPFPCNMCDRHFKRYSNLAQHKKVIHLKKKKVKDFYCHCGEIFQSRGKLLWHQETHAIVPKQCTFCSEKFTHTSSLTRHIRKNHDPCYLPVDRKKTDENVTCDICKIIVLKSTLKSHMRIHDTSKPFSCTICKKSFYTKWNLGLHQWTHVSRTHMPFKCKSCNRGFYSANEYQAHLRSHRNIRPYTCNYCGRKFIRKFNCIRHVREHEAKKKYNCTVCNKTFHRSYYLTAHIRVHNGERPFSCHICGKTSTTKSNHNKHVKTHHARETINTEG